MQSYIALSNTVCIVWSHGAISRKIFGCMDFIMPAFMMMMMMCCFFYQEPRKKNNIQIEHNVAPDMMWFVRHRKTYIYYNFNMTRTFNIEHFLKCYESPPDGNVKNQ